MDKGLVPPGTFDPAPVHPTSPGSADTRPGDQFGDRMKSYEAVTDSRLDGRIPVYARIDGRGFSRFTKGMERPFDPRMCDAMTETVKGLVERTHARIGYTQSDEISLVWLADSDESQVFFDGRLQKLASVLAGLATVLFNVALPRVGLDGFAGRLPHFDCRVLNLPSKTEAANMFLWREMDATKNAVQMVARHYFSSKALHGMGRADQLAMLNEIGVNFKSYPARFRRGVFVQRVNFQRAFTAAELADIPEKHRPAADALVTRSEVREVNTPAFVKVSNREAVIFDAARPEQTAGEGSLGMTPNLNRQGD